MTIESTSKNSNMQTDHVAWHSSARQKRASDKKELITVNQQQPISNDQRYVMIHPGQ